MNRSAKVLIKILEQYDFVFSRAKGSHQIYYNQQTGKTAVVPLHGNKDIPKGTFFAILKHAGIDKKEI